MVPARLPGLTELAKRSVYCVPGCEAEECERHSFVARICTLAQLNICHLEQALGICTHARALQALPAAGLTSFMVQPPTAISTLRLGFFCFSAIVSPYSWLSSFHSTGLSEKSA